MEDHHHKNAHHVKVLKGVKRKATHVFGRVISQSPCNIAVTQLMQGNANKSRQQSHQDTDNVSKVEAIPDGLYCADHIHPQFKVILPKNTVNYKCVSAILYKNVYIV